MFSEQYPVRNLDLIVNGEVAWRLSDEKGRTDWTLEHTLAITGSAWIAARAHGDAGTDAHTNPVYVYIGDARPFNPESVRHIIARLEASMATITIPDVVRRLGELKEELRRRIEPRPGPAAPGAKP